MSRCLLCEYEVDDPTLIFPKDTHSAQVPLELHQLRNLKWLVEESNACIVLSTTWRQVEEMRAFLLTALASVGEKNMAVLRVYSVLF